MNTNAAVERAALSPSGAVTRPLVGLLHMARRKPLGAAGGLVVGLMVLAAIAAPLLAQRDPYFMDHSHPLQPPGPQFLLGTDNFGRDMFSRILYGARVSLFVGLLSVAVGSSAGGAIGLFSGHLGGRLDIVMQRFLDAMMSFPTIVLALAIMVGLGSSVTNVIVAIAIVEIPRVARIVRASALSVSRTEYVEAARAIGCPLSRLVLVHTLPNCFAPYLVYASAAVAHAMLIEATLGFLGLGSPPPTPSWGAMLAGAGGEFVEVAPWLAIFPGVALSLAIFGFNLLGDALRDILDPRLR